MKIRRPWFVLAGAAVGAYGLSRRRARIRAEIDAALDALPPRTAPLRRTRLSEELRETELRYWSQKEAA